MLGYHIALLSSQARVRHVMQVAQHSTRRLTASLPSHLIADMIPSRTDFSHESLNEIVEELKGANSPIISKA